jgi:hypothetical protein
MGVHLQCLMKKIFEISIVKFVKLEWYFTLLDAKKQRMKYGVEVFSRVFRSSSLLEAQVFLKARDFPTKGAEYWC